jgi:hypothetical protein
MSTFLAFYEEEKIGPAVLKSYYFRVKITTSDSLSEESYFGEQRKRGNFPATVLRPDVELLRGGAVGARCRVAAP